MPTPLFEVKTPDEIQNLLAAIDTLAHQVKDDDPDDAAAAVRVELLRLAAIKLAQVPGYRADALIRTVREVLADLAPVATTAQASDVAAKLAAVPRSA